MRKTGFAYDNRKLEVRADLKGEECTVRVYENGSPANMVVYHVTWLTMLDTSPVDVVGGLMEVAEKDFIKWSDWLKKTRVR